MINYTETGNRFYFIQLSRFDLPSSTSSCCAEGSAANISQNTHTHTTTLSPHTKHFRHRPQSGRNEPALALFKSPRGSCAYNMQELSFYYFLYPVPHGVYSFYRNIYARQKIAYKNPSQVADLYFFLSVRTQSTQLL